MDTHLVRSVTKAEDRAEARAFAKRAEEFAARGYLTETMFAELAVQRLPPKILLRILIFCEQRRLNMISSAANPITGETTEDGDIADAESDSDSSVDDGYRTVVNVDGEIFKGIDGFEYKANYNAEGYYVNAISFVCMQGNRDIGMLNGRFVDRREIVLLGASLYGVMDEPSDDCANLAYTLLNQNGYVNSKWISNPDTKGSGVWGPPLSTGNFIVVEDIVVVADFRRQGMGRSLFKALLSHERCSDEDNFVQYIFAWATEAASGWDSSYNCALPDKEKKALFKANKDKAIRVFRSLGFRRVGSSHWFCYALDLDDPSHALAAEDDFDPMEGTVAQVDTDISALAFSRGSLGL